MAKAILTEGRKGTCLHWHCHIFSAPPCPASLSLALLGNYRVMLMWWCGQSPIHRLASGDTYSGGQGPSPPPYLRTSPSFGPWGTLLPTCTPVVLSRTHRNLTQFGMGCINHCPFPWNSAHVLPFSAPLRVVSAAGDRTDNKSTAQHLNAHEARSDRWDLTLHVEEAAEAPGVQKQCLGQSESEGFLMAGGFWPLWVGVGVGVRGWGPLAALKTHCVQAQTAQSKKGKALA